MNYTYEEKYKWLLSKLEIRDIDYFEQDALIILEEDLYFQFPSSKGTPDIDSAVEYSMSQERKTK